MMFNETSLPLPAPQHGNGMDGIERAKYASSQPSICFCFAAEQTLFTAAVC